MVNQIRLNMVKATGFSRHRIKLLIKTAFSLLVLKTSKAQELDGIIIPGVC